MRQNPWLAEEICNNPTFTNVAYGKRSRMFKSKQQPFEKILHYFQKSCNVNKACKFATKLATKLATNRLVYFALSLLSDYCITLFIMKIPPHLLCKLCQLLCKVNYN